MEDRNYEYEVALSFLAEDEDIAIQLAEQFSGSLRTFIYSRKQEVVAGTDGEETFNRIFGKNALSVVVLFREGWGSTAWTRIEETAIRNRAFDEGYDFVSFLSLDGSPMPPWLPKTRIWLNFARWGISGTASVIEARIGDLGGKPTVETSETLSKRLAREKRLKDQKTQFLESCSGVEAAGAELQELFSALSSKAQSIPNELGSLKVFPDERQRRVTIAYGRLSYTFAWSNQYANTLRHSALYVRLWVGDRFFPDQDKEPIRDYRYHFDRLTEKTTGWSEVESGQFYSSDDLADRHIKEILTTEVDDDEDD